MIRYATRLPPGKPVQLISDGIIRKIERCSMEKSMIFMEALINHFIEWPDPMVVPVYNFKVLSNKRNDYAYQYDMMRLGILTQEERNLIDHIGDLCDRRGMDAFDEPSPKEEYGTTLTQGEREFPQLFLFLKEVVRLNRYHDIHSGNILMDMDGDYRIIDLEGFLRTPLELPENDWISRL